MFISYKELKVCLFLAMVGDVNIYMNDLDDPHLAEIEIMIAEPKRYFICDSFFHVHVLGFLLLSYKI